MIRDSKIAIHSQIWEIKMFRKAKLPKTAKYSKIWV